MTKDFVLRIGVVFILYALSCSGAKVELAHLNDKNFTLYCDSRYYKVPECKESSNGYQCMCGPGFEYNSQGMCIAVSTNSLLEFRGGPKSQYAILVGKPLRALDSFTMTFWLRVRNRHSSGYIVSYSVKEHPNIFYLKLEAGSLVIKIYNETLNVGPLMTQENVWKHVTFSWDSKGGKYNVLSDSSKLGQKGAGGHFGSGLLLPASGETTLGARSHYFSNQKNSGRWDAESEEPEQSLQMDLSHFNVWFTVLPVREVRMIMKDCHLKYCGTAIRWTDFRDGTRGAVKLRWPSGVYNRCFGEWTDDEVTCDRYCSVIKGARCREEMIENVHWPRTEVSKTVEVECPGKAKVDGLVATRQCQITPAAGNKGKWAMPVIDACLSSETKEQIIRARDLSQNKLITYDVIFPFLARLINVTKPTASHTPNDLSAYIQVAEFILEFQADRIRNRNWLVERSQNEQSTKLYPNSTDIKVFMAQFVTVFNNLLPGGGNEKAWKLTKPFGQSLVHLFSIMTTFVDIHAGVLLRDVVVERSAPIAANFSQVMSKTSMDQEGGPFLSMAIRMEVHFSNHSSTLRYPREDQLLQGFSETRAIIKKNVWLGKSSLSKKRAFVVTTIFIGNVSEFLPNPAYEREKKPTEDALNSALYLIRFFPEDPSPMVQRDIVTTFSYLSTKNISDSQCFRLQYEKIRKGFVYKFAKQNCVRLHTTISRAMCTCEDSGSFYGVTTDMYDPNWVEEKIVIYFMNWATYFGCAMSALCSLLGFCILVFLRTTSNTSSLHKNTALAVGFAQLSLMCGIDLHEFLIPCRVFTIATLYFILCLFCWMMNQAFHIYSVVTYSVHNNDEVEDGSVIKFMIMGWVVPIIPVLIGALTKGDKFFHKGACFVSWDWFLIVGGPGVGIVFVTLLMKVIALKEYMQSSYSLSEKGNKLVVNYMKAGRSQWGTVLAMYCCLLVALRLHSTVLKFLFAIFSILQGSSLLCFSVLMNDEVRNILQNTYEGHKDKEEMDIIDELAEITHTQAVLAAHRLSKQRSAEKEGSFLKAIDEHSNSGRIPSPTDSNQEHYSPTGHRKRGIISQIMDVMGRGDHTAAAMQGGFDSGGPRDVQDENAMSFLDDSGMMDTAI
ncbi:putative Cadherin EGF LAG seven-pass G-type receptor 1 [Hypsibius exemplaris]|uniref:Cadherin EGF LAG seven-pass G-type receptor 1 n=1 Tax=Hypsibius exemplaris TaxID=2072580 RepID=A0A1W0WJY6_HYPEX|nr:putative Cadherin EGF LAG seven-pass G-type receptor 1 [Hypsibius exemplaris]